MPISSDYWDFSTNERERKETQEFPIHFEFATNSQINRSHKRGAKRVARVHHANSISTGSNSKEIDGGDTALKVVMKSNQVRAFLAQRRERQIELALIKRKSMEESKTRNRPLGVLRDSYDPLSSSSWKSDTRDSISSTQVPMRESISTLVQSEEQDLPIEARSIMLPILKHTTQKKEKGGVLAKWFRSLDSLKQH
jgi:hypothetical protein